MAQETFPEPAKLSDLLHEKGFKGVWMLDPGIKQEPGWSVYDSGTAEDVWVLQANKKPYAGKTDFSLYCRSMFSQGAPWNCIKRVFLCTSRSCTKINDLDNHMRTKFSRLRH